MPSHPQKSRTFPRLRLVWNAQSAPKVNWWRGLMGLQTRGGSDRGFVLHFAMKGLLLWSGSLVLICFILATAIGAYVLNKNPYNRISYADLVLPTRWSELREKRGQALIDGGLGEIKEQHYSAGVMMLAHGLKLKPTNISARLVLVEVYVQSGYVHRAMQLLQDGLNYVDEQKYLEKAFGLAAYLEDDTRIVAMAEKGMARLNSGDHARRRWLRNQHAAALVRLKSFQEVLDLEASSRNDPSMDLRGEWARAMSGLGRGEEAIEAILADPSRFGIFGAPDRLLMELALGNDRPDIGRTAAQSLVERDVTDYRGAVDQIVYLAEIHLPLEWHSALGHFFLRFGLNEAARITLLKRLETLQDAELLKAVWAYIEEIGQISIQARMAYVQNLILVGEVDTAEHEFGIARKEIGETGGTTDVWITGTRLLLDVLQTQADSSLSQLHTFCAERHLNPDAYRLLISGLLKNGLRQEAGEIAMVARNRYPAIRGIPDIEIRKSAVSAEDVLASKREIQIEQRVTTPEALQEWDLLKNDVQAKRWDAAGRRIAQIEKSPLAKELGAELLYENILIQGQLSRQTDLSWSMRQLMRRKTIDPSRLRTLAIRLHESGRTDSGLTLLREFLRKHPEARWAVNLRQQWLDELRTAPLETTPSS